MCDVLRRRGGDRRPRRRADRSTWPSSTAGPTRRPASSTRCSPRSASRSVARPGSAYEKVERRVGDWAVGAAGAALSLAEDGTIADATIGLTALGLEGAGRPRPPPCLRRAAAQRGPVRRGGPAGRARPAHPIEDQRGPVDYKRHLADELTRRVLRRALDRAGATPPPSQEG